VLWHDLPCVSADSRCVVAAQKQNKRKANPPGTLPVHSANLRQGTHMLCTVDMPQALTVTGIKPRVTCVRHSCRVELLLQSPGNVVSAARWLSSWAGLHILVTASSGAAGDLSRS